MRLPEPRWNRSVFDPEILVHGSVLRGDGMYHASEVRVETLVVNYGLHDECIGLGYHDSRQGQNTTYEHTRLAEYALELANDEATRGGGTRGRMGGDT